MTSFFNRRLFLERVALVAGGAASGIVFSGSPGSLGAQDRPVHHAEEKLRELKIELPVVPSSTSLAIVPCVRVGDMLYVSGHTPVTADGKNVVGRLGADMDVKQGYAAARLVALRVLSVVRSELGSLDRIVRVVKTLGMVNCMPDFTQSPAVVNGFSELFVQLLGDEAGKGARSAVGMTALPGGVPVEVEMILQVK